MQEEAMVEQKAPCKKKFYKRWWFWALIAVVVVVILTTMGGGEPTDLIDLPEQQYKDQCKTYSYDEIARNPDKYEKCLAKFTGEVIQVLKEGDQLQMRVNVTYDEFYYTDTVFVFYTVANNVNVLEGDIITMYGELRGMQEYESIFGEEISIPRIYVKFIEIMPK